MKKVALFCAFWLVSCSSGTSYYPEVEVPSLDAEYYSQGNLIECGRGCHQRPHLYKDENN